MTSHKPSRIRTAQPVQPVPYQGAILTPQSIELTDKAQRQADATLDTAAPLRYTPSMGKRLRQSEWSEPMKKAAHAALIAWNKP